MDAKLVLSKKLWFRNRYLLEMNVYNFPKSSKYPLGVRYSLILIDLKTKAKVLMDNHYPKGPHVHINNNEFEYEFKNIDKLIADFNKLVLDNIGVKL